MSVVAETPMTNISENATDNVILSTKIQTKLETPEQKKPLETVPEKPSWGGDLRKYAEAKTIVPAMQDVVSLRPKPKDYDIILGRSTDQRRESLHLESEAVDLVHQINVAKDNALHLESKYDLVNHRSKITGDVEDVAGRQFVGGRSHVKIKKAPHEDFNLISNNVKDGIVIKSETVPVIVPAKTLIETRDFDIISNKYIFDHQRKTQIDMEYHKLKAIEKFWKFNDFDPVRARDYDSDKELEFQKQHDLDSQEHGLEQLSKLPFRIRNSEGMMYDITSQRIKDTAMMENYEMRQAALKSGYQAKFVFEERCKNRNVSELERSDERQKNRVSTQRYIEQIRNGCDIISNVPYQGRLGKKPPRPQISDRFNLSKVLNSEGPKVEHNRELSQKSTARTIDELDLHSKANDESVKKIEGPVESEEISASKIVQPAKKSVPKNPIKNSENIKYEQSSKEHVSRESTPHSEASRKKVQPLSQLETAPKLTREAVASLENGKNNGSEHKHKPRGSGSSLSSKGVSLRSQASSMKSKKIRTGGWIDS